MSIIKPKMKQIFIFLVLFTLASCIPLRIAPTIKEDKIMVAKKFKRQLPKEYAFIFEDPKNAGDFYDYMDARFRNENLEADVVMSFKLNDKEYILNFYEVEIPTKYISLIPMFIDTKLGVDTGGSEVKRKGNWYFAITISDENMKDCLEPNYLQRGQIIQYLKKLRVDYLNSSDYNEILMRKW